MDKPLGLPAEIPLDTTTTLLRYVLACQGSVSPHNLEAGERIQALRDKIPPETWETLKAHFGEGDA